MSRNGSGGLDWCRLPAALLVVAIHTGPLLSYNTGANFVVTDILARLAVPFFFAVTGYFWLPRFQSQGRGALLPFLKKLLVLYGLSTLLYLPVKIYSGYFSQPGLGLELLRDIFFDGTFYHLWYFPAVLLGGCLLCLFVRKLSVKTAVLLCALLYLLGLLGDSYYAVAAALPPLEAFYQLLFHLFDYTRNGLFFAPVFLLLGGLLAARGQKHPPRYYAAAFLLSIAALLAEGLLVSRFALARFDALYVFLPLCLYYLLQWLRGLSIPERPGLRRLATVLYIVHPLCIVVIRAAARLLHLDWLLVQNSLVHYLAVVVLSFAVSLPFAFARRTSPDKTGRAWLEVEADALRHNLSALRHLLPENCQIMAVLKANAYGHGDLAVAKLCGKEGVRAFAVATAGEGMRLRRAGVRGTILVLGRSGPDMAPLLSRCRLTQTVVSLQHAAELDGAKRRILVHLKMDTGMHRLGIPWHEVETFQQIYDMKHLRVKGLFTHLARAECLSSDAQCDTQAQIRRFWSGVESMEQSGFPPGELHIQSSYGLLNYGQMPCAYVRVGIALYGLLSSPDDRTKIVPDLRPVLSLRARVVQIHCLEAGECAGYDAAFVADRPCRVANLSIGYADGYPRALSGGVGGVLIRGQYAPVAGLICMDQMLVDVTDIPDAAVGDIATLIGRDGAMELSAGLVAEAAGTITNELLSRLGGRLERRIVQEPRKES